MRPRRPKQHCLQLDIALWRKNQIEHSIWDESLLFCNCACSLEYSSLSTLAGLRYHICGKLEVAFKEARKGFFGCYSVCETMKDTKEGYFIM